MRRDAMAGAALLFAATLVVIGLLDGRKIAVGRNVFVNQPGIIDAYSTPTIFENPRRSGNEIAVFRKDAPRLSAQLAWSTDGNKTWHTTALPLPPGDDRPFFPDAAFAPDGMLYVAYVNLTGTGNTPANLFVAHSSDGGRTLSEPTLVASGLTFQPRIAVGPDGVLHIVWLQVMKNGTTPLANASEQVVAAQSTDHGLTWSAPVGVSAPPDHLVGAATPAAVGRGVLVVAYEDFGARPSRPGNGGTAPSGQPFDLLVARSVSGGTAFSVPTIVASAVRSGHRFSYFFPEFPGVAGGPHHAVYLAWSANRDVLLRRSTNDGATWQPPVRVHRAAGGSATLPAVSVAPAGRVDVVYLNEPGVSPGLFTDVHLATSSDEGRTFRDVRLSSESFDARIGPTLGGLPPDLGSHLGVAGTSNTIYAAWGDTRLGTDTTGREDIVAASVTGVGSGVTARWWFLAAAALAAVGLVLLVRSHGPRVDKVIASEGPGERGDGVAGSP